jgi:hypothetical protein
VRLAKNDYSVFVQSSCASERNLTTLSSVPSSRARGRKAKATRLASRRRRSSEPARSRVPCASQRIGAHVRPRAQSRVSQRRRRLLLEGGVLSACAGRPRPFRMRWSGCAASRRRRTFRSARMFVLRRAAESFAWRASDTPDPDIQCRWVRVRCRTGRPFSRISLQ